MLDTALSRYIKTYLYFFIDIYVLLLVVLLLLVSAGPMIIIYMLKIIYCVVHKYILGVGSTVHSQTINIF